MSQEKSQRPWTPDSLPRQTGKEPWTRDDINNVADVERFFAHLSCFLGPGWHPDVDFANYLDNEGEDLYTDEQATILNTAMSKAFEICDDASPKVDVYDIKTPRE